MIPQFTTSNCKQKDLDLIKLENKSIKEQLLKQAWGMKSFEAVYLLIKNKWNRIIFEIC
jgi:hypothetical protein